MKDQLEARQTVEAMPKVDVRKEEEVVPALAWMDGRADGLGGWTHETELSPPTALAN